MVYHNVTYFHMNEEILPSFNSIHLLRNDVDPWVKMQVHDGGDRWAAVDRCHSAVEDC